MSHPSVRIATLISFAVALALSSSVAAAFLAALAVAAIFFSGTPATIALSRLLVRSRWLLLLVVVLNAWGTPGSAAWVGAPAWVPSHAGLQIALHRGATLVAMLAAVSLLLSTTPRSMLVAGIAWLAQPLRAIGAAPERLALRLAGTLGELGSAEHELRHRARTLGWRAALAQMFEEIERRAAGALPQADPSVVPPPALAWLWPAAMLAFGVALGWS